MITGVVEPFMLPFVKIIFYSVNIPGLGISFPLIVGWLVIAASVFTFYFGFIQFRAFGHSLALVSGKSSNPKDAGEVSHFQALATALSGTVGLGNIAGVAVAVSIGGPGATFWMILAGLLGMASKFTECTSVLNTATNTLTVLFQVVPCTTCQKDCQNREKPV